MLIQILTLNQLQIQNQTLNQNLNLNQIHNQLHLAIVLTKLILQTVNTMPKLVIVILKLPIMVGW